MEYELDQDKSLSMAVVRAVSDAEGRDPLDLPPLATVIDPDALDALFVTDQQGEPQPRGSLSFIFSDSRITIVDGASLTIQPTRDSRTSTPGQTGHSDP